MLVVLWLLWSGTYAWSWTRMRRVDSPLGLHAFGVFARSQFGTIEVPWEAVQSATIERHWNGRRLRIRAGRRRPTRGTPASSTTSSDAMRQIVDKHGMRFSLRLLDVDRRGAAVRRSSSSPVAASTSTSGASSCSSSWRRRTAITATEHHERPEREQQRQRLLEGVQAPPGASRPAAAEPPSIAHPMYG